MSLSINTNLAALTALNNVNDVSTQLNTSIERLSSGLTINSAGDNPAGLVITQNMAGQLSGISQALSNSQNAVNLAKTADGGLSSIENLLQQIRSIAVAAANNASQSQGELQADQAQITSAIQSIDSIASNTSWAGQNLLDGSAGVQSAVSDITDIAGINVTNPIGGQPIGSGPVTVQVTTMATQTTLTTNQAFTGTGAVVPAGAFSINGYTFTSDGATTTVQSVLDAINGESNETGVDATAVANGAGVSIQLQSTQYGSNFPVNVYDSSHLLDTTTSPTPTVAGQNAVATVTVPTTSSTGPSTATETFTGGTGPTGSGLEMTDQFGNRITLTPTGNNTTDLTSPTGVGTLTPGQVRFQIGADAGNQAILSLGNASSYNLGAGVVPNQDLSNIDVTTAQGAQQAIQVIDSAIDQVSTMRGTIGAFQSDLLTPTTSMLNTASQNMSSAMSSIQDTDIAGEMTTYTKNQILEQSGMAMLSQANQNPQQVLQLLRGS